MMIRPDSMLTVGNASFEWGARTYIMGIVNVTPDSFSDGGRLKDAQAAAEHAVRLVREGADILDFGGESSRPYSEPVTAEDEMKRTIPAIQETRKRTDCPISIDTRKAAVAEAALDAGANMVNDITALEGDPEMMHLVAERSIPVVLMHMKGNPANMQESPFYEDPVKEICEYLQTRVNACMKAGIKKENIIIDPGIGFGKRIEDNIDLINGLSAIRKIGQPVLTGVSRKAFIGAITGIDPPDMRDAGTAGAVAACVMNGSDIVRVHNVRAVKDAIMVIDALKRRMAGREWKPAL